MSQERRAAKELSQEIDRLYAMSPQERDQATLLPVSEMAVAQRLRRWGQDLPPVPEPLRQRVRTIVATHAEQATLRPKPGQLRWRSAAWGALAATMVLLSVFLILPTGQQVLAQAMRILLGQTEVALTPTLPPPTRAMREPLPDLLAVELTMGRAPSLPRALPEGYVLREMVAVSYPDLPEWISQPFYVELAYGPEGSTPGLWLREYRLLFREYGGIKGISAASQSVARMEEVDVSGVRGAMLTFSAAQETHALVWERDGLLLELKTDCLSEQELLEVAQSVR
jgi:hypothetical protein